MSDSGAGLRNRVRCRGRGDHPWNSQPIQAVADLPRLDQSRRRVGLRTAFQTASGGWPKASSAATEAVAARWSCC